MKDMLAKPGETVKTSDRTYIVDEHGSFRVDSYHPENTRDLPEFVNDISTPVEVEPTCSGS